MVSNKLYVGNLSFKTTAESVEALFAAVGEVREVAMPQIARPANLVASPLSPWPILSWQNPQPGNWTVPSWTAGPCG